MIDTLEVLLTLTVLVVLLDYIWDPN